MNALRTMGGKAILAIAVAATFLAPAADARRGGSFGSRGSHTYYAPSATRLAPGYVPPVSRSMTARPQGTAPQYAPSAGAQYAPGYRPRFGFGGGLLTGLVTGGLLGAMFGHGWGGGYGAGGGGLLSTILQLALLGGVIWLGVRLFRGRAASTPPQPFAQSGGFGRDAPVAQPGFGPSVGSNFATSAPPSFGPGIAPPGEAITLQSGDQDIFERLLAELQDAFGHEDYGRLRAITTPEVMSYLAEELSDNATHGRRNEVSGTRLLDGEVSEAWREGDTDYATIAMRYESIDVTRDRATNAVLSGDPSRPTETTELWTFTRPSGSSLGWKISAIQEA